MEPFSALTLPPFRIGDPGSARAFARPYREVTARLRRWDGGGVRRDPDPAVYVHQYRHGDRTVRGIVAVGYEAILVDRAGYPDAGVQLESDLRAMSNVEPLVSPDGRWSLWNLAEIEGTVGSPSELAKLREQLLGASPD